MSSVPVATRVTTRAAALSPEKRREAIVSATLPLLVERGLAVTTRQIAEAAGIAEGTIFRAFPDKDALIDAVIETALDPAPLEARLAEIDTTLPLEQRLVLAVRVLQERVMNVWQVLSSVGFRPPKAEREGRQQLTDLASLAALFSPDESRLRYDAVRCARRLRALVIAGNHPSFAGDEPMTADEIVTFFLDGALQR